MKRWLCVTAILLLAASAALSMQTVWCKYGTETEIRFFVFDSNSPWSLYDGAIPAADIMVIRNTKAPVAVTNSPTDYADSTGLVLTEAEMTATRIWLQIKDQDSPALYGDEIVAIETFGDPNAALPFDFSSPTVALTAGSLKAATYDGSTAFPITGAALDSTALASTADMGMVVAATPVTLADGPHGGSSATLVLSDYSNFQGAAGDPWSITLPGEYGSGSAGYILGTNLDVTVGSRSSHAAADVWSVEARTITGGFPTAQNIWEYPGTPTVSLAGLGDWSTFNPLADAVVLDPAYDAAKTAMQTGAAVDLSGPSMDGVAAAVGTLLPADFDTVTVSEGKIAADAVVSLTPQELATIASASKADQVVTTVAAGSHTASSFVLAAGPATDGWFGGRYWWVTVVDATNNMPGGGIVSGYVGETKTISLETALPFTPAQGDAVYILPMSGQALWSR